MKCLYLTTDKFRYYGIDKKRKLQILLKRLNTLSMWLGSLGALGVSLVANFQVMLVMMIMVMVVMVIMVLVVVDKTLIIVINSGSQLSELPSVSQL